MTGLFASVAERFARIPKMVLFGAAALIQIALLGAMITDRARILRGGTEVKLLTRPIDPRDLLRGDYVVLGYDISQLPTGALLNQPAGSRNPDVFVKLAPKPDGLYGAVSVHADGRAGHEPRGADPRPRYHTAPIAGQTDCPSATRCRSATISRNISFPKAKARSSKMRATSAS